MVSDVGDEIRVSASFYTGIHGKAYYNGDYDTRDGISTLKELNDFFVNKYPYRYFHYVSLEEESSWCGAEPMYVLICPETITPVERDEYRDQVYVGVTGLRLRSEPKITAKVNGTAPNGYLYAEVTNGDQWEDRGISGDIWYKVDNYYIAGVEGVDFFPKKQSDPVNEIEKLLKSLSDEINQLKKENEDLKGRLERIKENVI